VQVYFCPVLAAGLLVVGVVSVSQAIQQEENNKTASHQNVYYEAQQVIRTV
jgi:hypothetical protein